jgi:hypothetical protein
MWIPLVNKFGGVHHGYFMPHEGANNIPCFLFRVWQNMNNIVRILNQILIVRKHLILPTKPVVY